MYTRQIESFIKTADAGSFSKAARTLYISPSSLIQQIDLLERRLGIALFERGRKGITLTEAGKSLYRDALEIVRRSDEAVARARRIQDGEGPIKVATSLLMKCRILPEIWSRMLEDAPGTHIDIVSLEQAGVEPGNYLRGLGVNYDVMEGLYMSELYVGRCTFLELVRSPLCLTVPKSLGIAGHGGLDAGTLDADLLKSLDLVMMRRGVSEDYDKARSRLESLGAGNITDVPYYTMELFADCELNGRSIVTPRIWSDIHPNMTPIPLGDGLDISYGLVLPLDPNKQVAKLYETAKAMRI